MGRKAKANGNGSEKTTEAQDYELGIETLTGDVRDALLTHVRSMEDPWSKLSEKKQQDKIFAVQSIADDLVRRAVSLIAAQGFDHVLVTVRKMTISEKGIVQSVFDRSKAPDNVIHLMERQNAQAVLILCDPTDYFGERVEAKPQPDQPEIPLGEALHS
jgi:hypothetical protein